MPGMARKKQRRGRNTQGKKQHLLNVLTHANGNMRELSKNRPALRCFAWTLHCTSQGVRLRWDADHGGDKDVKDCVQTFLITTTWKDLLTDQQRREGDEKLLALATKKKKLAAEQVIGLPFFIAWSFFL